MDDDQRNVQQPALWALTLCKRALISSSCRTKREEVQQPITTDLIQRLKGLLDAIKVDLDEYLPDNEPD